MAASDASCSTVDFLLIRVIYLMRKKRERKKERRETKRIKNKINELLLYTIQYTVRYTQHTIQTAHPATPLAKLKIEEWSEEEAEVEWEEEAKKNFLQNKLVI